MLEAKSNSIDLAAAEAQAQLYADQLGVPFILLSKGEEVWFRDKTHDAHFRRVETVFTRPRLGLGNISKR